MTDLLLVHEGQKALVFLVWGIDVGRKIRPSFRVSQNAVADLTKGRDWRFAFRHSDHNLSSF